MKLIELLNKIKMQLPDHEAKQLACFAFDCTLNKLLLMYGCEVESVKEIFLCSLAKKRAEGVPLQYILGETGFFGNDFIVTPDVLIPRQDTETLVLCALEYLKGNEKKEVLDLCCGSGCIGISVYKNSCIKLTLADISEKSLYIAKKNAERLDVKADFICSDMFAAVGKYDLILINPPYLTENDMNNLQTELKSEPYNALFGGKDGLDFYRIISKEYKKHLKPSGRLLMEIGSTQAKEVIGIFGGNCSVFKDLSGNDRVILA